MIRIIWRLIVRIRLKLFGGKVRWVLLQACEGKYNEASHLVTRLMDTLYPRVSKLFRGRGVQIVPSNLYYRACYENIKNCIKDKDVKDSTLLKLLRSNHETFCAIWYHLYNLILPVPCISESCIEIKIKLNFYFHTSLWCLKRFYEGLKGLHKTF